MIKQDKFLMQEEIDCLLGYVSIRWQADNQLSARYKWRLMLLLMLDAGLRLSETLNLKWFDLVWKSEAKELLILRPEIAKNKTIRSIPISVRLRLAINNFYNRQSSSYGMINDYFVFPSNDFSKHISNRGVQHMFESLGRKSFGRKLTPHMLRHTFATRLMKVCPISVVQNLLGHKSITSTQLYVHPTIEDSVNAIKAVEL